MGKKIQINTPDVMDYADLTRAGLKQTRSMPENPGTQTPLPVGGTRSSAETDRPHIGGRFAKRGSVDRVTKSNREGGY